MNALAKNQQQIEFEVFGKEKENKPDYTYLAGVRSDTGNGPAVLNVIFSYQSVIIVFLCILMLLVASFVLGVEKGKLIAKNMNPAVAPQASGTMQTQPPAADAQISQAALPQPPAKSPENTAVAKETIVPAPTKAEETPARSGYTIQVASVKSESAAKTLAESLIKKGLAAFTKNSGHYVVVLAGNFARREEAQMSLRELKKTFADCFIKRI